MILLPPRDECLARKNASLGGNNITVRQEDD